MVGAFDLSSFAALSSETFEITPLGDRPVLTGLVILNGDLLTRAPLISMLVKSVLQRSIISQR